MTRVAVLGAGLQGACAALELASAGIAVDLYEKQNRCVTRASAQNEGKIHLGFVFGNDPTLATARAMARGAVTFAPLLRRWLGDALDGVPVSAPFHYVIHAQSLRTVDEIGAHLDATHRVLLEESAGIVPDYFGSDYREAPVRLSDRECFALYDRRTTAAAFRTPEIAIDPEALAGAVRVRLAGDPRIRCLTGATVHAAEPDADRVLVTAERDETVHRESYDHVVNCLWDGRLAVDRTAGVEPPRPWLYRVKYQLRVSCPGAAVPATTIVLGPFGDTAAYTNGELCLSWYPAGMRAVSSDLRPPEWPTPDERVARGLREAIVSGLADIIPAVGNLPVGAVEDARIRGGVIFAWGETDIDDPASALHERHAIGPQSFGRYHSVDTGKLTTAPLFGKQVADRIIGAS